MLPIGKLIWFVSHIRIVLGLIVFMVQINHQGHLNLKCQSWDNKEGVQENPPENLPAEEESPAPEEGNMACQGDDLRIADS